MEVNLNELAWKTPRIEEGDNGFWWLPGTMYKEENADRPPFDAYAEICRQLKQGEKVWTADSDDKTIKTARVRIPGWNHDVIVDYRKKDKALRFVFKERGTYHV